MKRQRSFQDQVLTVLADGKAIVAQARQIQALREKDGRTLGAERREQLRQLADEFRAIAALLLDIAREERKAELVDATQDFAKFEEIQARFQETERKAGAQEAAVIWPAEL